MKITFVAIGSEQLGMSQLSAIAKANGHEVNVAFAAMLFNDRYNLEFPAIAKYFDDTKNVLQTIEATQPDIVAYSPLTGSYKWMLDVATKAKEINPSVKNIFGGVHTSAVPDRVIAKPMIDYVVTGEGDVAFADIIHAIEKNDCVNPIPNTRFKNKKGEVVKGIQKGFIQDLNALPFYDKTIWEDYIRIGDLYLTMASRGCPYRCTFCFNNFFAKLPEEKGGKYVRIRSVEHVMAELHYAKKRYKLRVIDFQDDIFTTSKVWLKEFLSRYKKEINLPFQILTHPRYMDDDIARWLSEAGCQWIQMGVQSMDESFKKDNLLRYERSEDVSVALEVMTKYGMKVKVDHMFGLPGEPVEAQQIALDLYASHPPQRIQTFWTTLLPGTAMMNEAVEQGTLSVSDAEKIYEGEEFMFFRNYESIKDSGLMNQYKMYEMLFRILPILPKSMRINISINSIKFIPIALHRPLSMMADVLVGFSLRNPEFATYLNHNLFHLYRFVALRLGFKNIKATRPKKDKPPTNTDQEIKIVAPLESLA